MCQSQKRLEFGVEHSVINTYLNLLIYTHTYKEKDIMQIGPITHSEFLCNCFDDPIKSLPNKYEIAARCRVGRGGVPREMQLCLGSA